MRLGPSSIVGGAATYRAFSSYLGKESGRTDGSPMVFVNTILARSRATWRPLILLCWSEHMYCFIALLFTT
jgi:hypothetical protein